MFLILGRLGELGWAFCSLKYCQAKGDAKETGQSLQHPRVSWGPCPAFGVIGTKEGLGLPQAGSPSSLALYAWHKKG